MNHRRLSRLLPCFPPLFALFNAASGEPPPVDTTSAALRSDTVRAAVDASLPVRPIAASDSSAFTLTVYGRRKQAVFDTIVLADEQRKTGATDDVNKILTLQKGVQCVPEAGSALLIHGGGLYDNAYFVNGVRMMAPSHFPGHSFADRSGLFISALKNISLIANTSGRYRDAGSVVSFRPGIIRLNEKEIPARPELIVQAGSLDDYRISLSLPYKDTTGMLQIAGRQSNDYYMKWKSTVFGNGNAPMSPFVWSDSASLGYSIPVSFGDASLTAEHHGKSMHSQAFGWFSYDSYGPAHGREAKFVPWGMVSFTLKNHRGAGFFLDAGGSRQHEYSGKKFGYVTPLKHILRDNAALSIGRDVISGGNLTFTTGLRGEGVRWAGELNSHWTKINGSSADSTFYRGAGGDEATLESHSTLRYAFPKGDVTANVLLGASLWPELDPFADPGVTVTINGNNSMLRAHAGVYSSRPDIRGLPDPAYRNTPAKTWAASIEFDTRINTRLSGSAQGYAKWTRRCPAFSRSPALPIWDPGRETELLVGGCAFNADLDIVKNALSLRIVQDINNAERIASGKTVPYEWEIPWSTSAILRYSVSRHTRLYLTGMFAAGLPYLKPVMEQDELVLNEAIHRGPLYRRVDLKFENIVPLRNKRHFRQRVVYVDIINILNAFEGLFGPSQWLWENTREYYWDDKLRQRPLILEYAAIAFGLKLGFAL